MFAETLAVSVTSAQADIIGRLWINQGARMGDASLDNVPPEDPDAWFNPAVINFDSRVTRYSINQFLHSPSFYNTSAGFDPDGISENVFYLFTGTLFLQEGDNEFQIPHDDGLQLNIDGMLEICLTKLFVQVISIFIKQFLINRW